LEPQRLSEFGGNAGESNQAVWWSSHPNRTGMQPGIYQRGYDGKDSAGATEDAK
jgi:hypothetical protein